MERIVEHAVDPGANNVPVHETLLDRELAGRAIERNLHIRESDAAAGIRASARAIRGRRRHQTIERGLAANPEVSDVDLAFLRRAVEMGGVEQNAAFAALDTGVVVGIAEQRNGITRCDVEHRFAAVAGAQFTRERSVFSDLAEQREAADSAVAA